MSHAGLSVIKCTQQGGKGVWNAHMMKNSGVDSGIFPCCYGSVFVESRLRYQFDYCSFFDVTCVLPVL